MDTGSTERVEVEPKRVDSLKVFAHLNQGEDPFEIMQELKVDIGTMYKLIQQYNLLQAEKLKKDTRTDEKYTGALFEFARLIGDPLRDECQWYNDINGFCEFWNLRDVDPEFREKYPGYLQGGGAGNKMRIRAMYHPEVCALCQQARLFSNPTRTR